jgi:CheY-like chemotaxis protein
VVADGVRLLSATLPPKVHLKFTMPEVVLPSLWADPTQVHQVVTNLLTNAIHAVEARGAGEVNVSLQVAPETNPGLWLLVHDNGVGMSQEVQERIFEPFFTTKPPGRGSGLGLAIVHSIIEAHGGNIQVRSSPNHGTHVRVFLPLGSPEIDRPAPAAPMPLDPTSPKGLVLFVDDEELLRAMGSAYLARLGYTPLVAADATQAERLVADPALHLTALVTDQVMPGGSGLDLIQRLRRRQPRLPAVLMTGLIADLRAELAGQPEVVVLEKPFRLEELAQALARAVAVAAEVPA